MTGRAAVESAVRPVRLRGTASTIWIDAGVLRDRGVALGGDELTGWLEQLVSNRVAVERVLKDEPRRSVVQLKRAQGLEWVLKGYRVPPWSTRLAPRRTPPWREWRGASRLGSAGLRVNRPAALVSPRPASGVVWLVLPYAEGDCLHHLIADAPPPERWSSDDRARRIAVAEAIGRQAGRLLAAGLVNRDHKVGNLIIDEACRAGACEPVIIDPVGVGVRRRPGQARAMLEVLLRTARRAGHVERREIAAARRAARAAMGRGRADPIR